MRLDILLIKFFKCSYTSDLGRQKVCNFFIELLFRMAIFSSQNALAHLCDQRTESPKFANFCQPDPLRRNFRRRVRLIFENLFRRNEENPVPRFRLRNPEFRNQEFGRPGKVLESDSVDQVLFGVGGTIPPRNISSH